MCNPFPSAKFTAVLTAHRPVGFITNLNHTDVYTGCNQLLIISQFTLFADCKSRRPGFSKAARPETAIPLYEAVIALCKERGFNVATGEFGAEMLVTSENDGPLTILLDTKEL